MRRLKNFFHARRVRNALERLDERLLQDIGISRSDIDRISKTKANPAGSTWRRSVHFFD